MDAEGGTTAGLEAGQGGSGAACSVCGSPGCCPDLHTPQADARSLQCPGAPRLPPPALPPDTSEPTLAVGHPPMGLDMPVPGLGALPPLLQQPRGDSAQHLVHVLEAATMLRRAGAPSVTMQEATWLGGPAASLPPWQAAMLGIQPPTTTCGPAAQDTRDSSGSSTQATTAGQDSQQSTLGLQRSPPALGHPDSSRSSTALPAPGGSSSPAAALPMRPPPRLQGAVPPNMVDE